MNFAFACLLSLIVNSMLVASEIPNKNTSIFGWLLSSSKPLTKEELNTIEEKNKQRQREIARLEKRIARLQEDSSDDESTGKSKQD